ncbi:MAG: hypothetical protein S4CHLAM6_12570 [Chlamydiae bacterium]|nr:hypothetical protein [Chlamydiota bacterium]
MKSAGLAAANLAAAGALLTLAATQLDSQKVCLNMAPTNGYSSSNYCLPQITNIRLVKPFANFASESLRGNEAITGPLISTTSLALGLSSLLFVKNAVRHAKDFMSDLRKI